MARRGPSTNSNAIVRLIAQAVGRGAVTASLISSVQGKLTEYTAGSCSLKTLQGNPRKPTRPSGGFAAKWARAKKTQTNRLDPWRGRRQQGATPNPSKCQAPLLTGQLSHKPMRLVH